MPPSAAWGRRPLPRCRSSSRRRGTPARTCSRTSDRSQYRSSESRFERLVVVETRIVELEPDPEPLTEEPPRGVGKEREELGETDAARAAGGFRGLRHRGLEPRRHRGLRGARHQGAGRFAHALGVAEEPPVTGEPPRSAFAARSSLPGLRTARRPPGAREVAGAERLQGVVDHQRGIRKPPPEVVPELVDHRRGRESAHRRAAPGPYSSRERRGGPRGGLRGRRTDPRAGRPRSPRRAGPDATRSNVGNEGERGNAPSLRPMTQTTSAGKTCPGVRLVTVTASASRTGSRGGASASSRSTWRTTSNPIGDTDRAASRSKSRTRTRSSATSSATGAGTEAGTEAGPEAGPGADPPPPDDEPPPAKKRSSSSRSTAAHSRGCRSPASRERSANTPSQYVTKRPSRAPSSAPVSNPPHPGRTRHEPRDEIVPGGQGIARGGGGQAPAAMRARRRRGVPPPHGAPHPPPSEYRLRAPSRGWPGGPTRRSRNGPAPPRCRGG